MKYLATDSETYGEMVAAPEPSTFSIEGHWLVEHVNEHTCGTGKDGYYGAHEPGCGTLPVQDLAQMDGWDEHVAAIKAEAWDEGFAAGLTPPCNANPYRTDRAESADLAAICPVPPFPRADRIEVTR